MPFTIFTQGDGAYEANRVGSHFMLATSWTSRLSQWDQKIEGKNREEILPINLSEAKNLRWGKYYKCISNIGFYSLKAATNDLTEPYSLVFNNQGRGIGIYLCGETQQQSLWQPMQATEPFPYPQLGAAYFSSRIHQ